MVTKEQVNLVSTGNLEIDQALDGGIPLGSLVLMEGQSDAGKSIFAQHFTHGSLRSGLQVAHYSTESTIKNLMSQMVSLDLDVTDYFLCDRLRVYPVKPADDADSTGSLDSLLRHFESLPIDIRLIIVDALTGLVPQGDERQAVDFFAGCKQLCDLGRAIILAMESDGEDSQLLERARDICDSHLMLRIGEQDEHHERVMEIAKLNNIAADEGKLVHFSVEPGFGLKVLSPAGGRR